MIADRLKIRQGRTYLLDDEGDAYALHLIEDGLKIGTVLFDILDNDPNKALDDACALGHAFVMRFERYDTPSP
jgi:hypothetical protein